MAKWGEGDPRWIVEERADAKNVNNWHWIEKKATQWSIDKIKALLTGFTIDTDKCKKVVIGYALDYLEIVKVNKCEGEAAANNRKAKLIIFYEWAIEMEWKGHKKSVESPSKVCGTIAVNNLSEEYSPEEWDFDVSCQSTKPDANEVKEFLRTEGVCYLRKQLQIYITDLKHEYGKDLILPTKDKQGSSDLILKQTPNNKAPVDALWNSDISSTKKHVTSGEAGTQDTVQISLQEDFMCTPEDLYKVFITEELTKLFTRGNAIVQSTPGGKYAIFDGNVSGSFIDLEPNKMISMSWRKDNWPENHHSTVRMDLEQIDTGTRLKLTQTNVPASDEEGTQSGWQTHYFMPIQQTFGFGGKIF
ncbi:Activator of 90 kDa heat shock protein ATPase -like protein 1 [Echinococcus granulosus]|uniref:Activator of heat shock protein ATPase n=1 Tax=Echinococcus granulosus TaxID=6210 RepID=W6UDI1_ECHGR|nr:Activator of heat shock protein ATPase [Echinococcus granulosus]EUB59063.1 Activator of heat shock protein ATPase [Echinococcus granulosus]KAH9284847.1 Activator of 90 kDa heat shock protein ATPase -like protein 1 [Echinococcus granulosus]